MVRPAARRPAYERLAAELRAHIADGTYPLGSQLPSIADLMKRHDLSVTPVRTALALLRAEGIVRSEQGRGYFVRALPDPEPSQTDLATCREEIDDLRRTVQWLTAEVDRLMNHVIPPTSADSPGRGEQQ